MASQNYIEPARMRVPDALRYSAFSRADLYRRAARGEITFIKCGRATLVDVASLKAAMAALPTATLRAPKIAA